MEERPQILVAAEATTAVGNTAAVPTDRFRRLADAISPIADTNFVIAQKPITLGQTAARQLPIQQSSGNLKKYDPDQAWQLQGACQAADPEIFYRYETERTKKLRDQSAAIAKEFCKRCIVKEHCLRQATKPDRPEESGIWGGLTADERGV